MLSSVEGIVWKHAVVSGRACFHILGGMGGMLVGGYRGQRGHNVTGGGGGSGGKNLMMASPGNNQKNRLKEGGGRYGSGSGSGSLTNSSDPWIEHLEPEEYTKLPRRGSGQRPAAVEISPSEREGIMNILRS